MTLPNTNNKLVFTILFISLMVLISLIYGYHETLFKKPQSVHGWRQADNASIALNYYQYDLNFFEPEVHNLTMDGGTSGKAATSEVPWLYFTLAQLYKIFGHHDFIFRLTVVVIFFTGLAFLYKLFLYVLSERFWAMALAGLFFTSPLLVYYGNNFLTEVPALSLAIIGSYYFLLYYREHSYKYFLFSIMFFLIAGSLRVTGLISFFAIAGLFLYQMVFGNLPRHLTMKPFIKKVVPFIIPPIIILAWIIYADVYNEKHEGHYFLTKTFPVWNYEPQQLWNNIKYIGGMWLDHYVSIPTYIIFFVLFIFIIVRRKYADRLLLTWGSFLILIVLVYVLMLFQQFRDHDYYMVNLFIIPVFIFLISFDILKRSRPRIFRSPWLKVGFVLFLAYNVYHTLNVMNLRYEGWMGNYAENKDFHYISPFLREIGIEKGDTAIVMPDGSHQLLYLMNLRGWTNYVDPGINTGIQVRYNDNAYEIQKSIQRGANYLIINGQDILNERSYLRHFTKGDVASFNNVQIYQLQGAKLQVPKGKKLISFTCGAENTTADGRYFITTQPKALLAFGSLQSDSLTYSGNFGVRLDNQHPYAMTYQIDNVHYGEKISLRTWKYGNNSNLRLVIQETSNELFLSGNQVIQTDSANWQQISYEWYVTPDFNYKSFKVFLWYKGEGAAYADDFTVSHIKVFEP